MRYIIYLQYSGSPLHCSRLLLARSPHYYTGQPVAQDPPCAWTANQNLPPVVAIATSKLHNAIIRIHKTHLVMESAGVVVLMRQVEHQVLLRMSSIQEAPDLIEIVSLQLVFRWQ